MEQGMNQKIPAPTGPMKPFPLRKVVRTTFCSCRYNRRGEGSYRFDLECGHFCFAKISAGQPKRKRCLTCGTGYEPRDPGPFK